MQHNCPHCKEPVSNCNRSMIYFKIGGTSMNIDGIEDVLHAEICHALSICNSQVSVYRVATSKQHHHFDNLKRWMHDSTMALSKTFQRISFKNSGPFSVQGSNFGVSKELNARDDLTDNDKDIDDIGHDTKLEHIKQSKASVWCDEIGSYNFAVNIVARSTAIRLEQQIDRNLNFQHGMVKKRRKIQEAEERKLVPTPQDAENIDQPGATHDKGIFLPTTGRKLLYGQRMDHESKSEPTKDELINRFLSQALDPKSRLRRGRYMRDCTFAEKREEVPNHEHHHCMQCHQKREQCQCSCNCCDARKAGCPALCQPFCSHCALPVHVCSSSDVSFMCHLDERHKISDDSDLLEYRKQLHTEVCALMKIHPLQAHVSDLTKMTKDQIIGSLQGTIHFTSCQEVAVLTGERGTCMATGNPLPSEGSPCKCPATRKILADQFVGMFKDDYSALWQSKLLKTFTTVRRLPPNFFKNYAFNRVRKCRKCNHPRSHCICTCDACNGLLDSCFHNCSVWKMREHRSFIDHISEDLSQKTPETSLVAEIVIDESSVDVNEESGEQTPDGAQIADVVNRDTDYANLYYRGASTSTQPPPTCIVTPILPDFPLQGRPSAITRMQARTLSTASVHEPVSETVSPSSVTDQECFVGLEIGRRLPYDVIAVDDLVDTSFLVQGETGYQNEPVLPGDHVLFVDGYDAHSLSPDEVHGLLRGRFCFLYVP